MEHLYGCASSPWTPCACGAVVPVAPPVSCHDCGRQALVVESGVARCGGCSIAAGLHVTIMRVTRSGWRHRDHSTEPGRS